MLCWAQEQALAGVLAAQPEQLALAAGWSQLVAVRAGWLWERPGFFGAATEPAGKQALSGVR